MLDQNVPNPLAKNPSFHTHKVFASVGIILIVTIAVVAGVWYFVQSAKDKAGSAVDNTAIKISTPSAQAKNKITSKEIVFEKDGSVYFLKDLTSSPQRIGDVGSSPKISPDKTKVAYISTTLSKDSVPLSSSVHIYDISTGKDSILSINDNNNPFKRGLIWSENGKYLAVDSGDDVIGGDMIYSFPEGKQILSNSFSVANAKSGLIWFGDNQVIYSDPQNVDPPRPYGSGQGGGITEIAIPTGTKQILLKPTGTIDYGIVRIDGSNLIFTQTVVKSSDDWSSGDQSKQILTYWQINLQNMQKQQINNYSSIHDQIVKDLPSEFSSYQVWAKQYTGSTWYLLDLYKPNSPEKIGILDTSDPKSTFKEIATGSNPDW